jgi:DNA mismatch repair protein MutL
MDEADNVQTRAGIQPLNQEVISLMAAGEVIDSLSAVVRELIENALDAGASRISVSLWPEQWQVRVADNGAGMSLADLHQAAIAHATSKIFSCPDLLNVSSLGFRGEALHSIAQLAQLDICSRPQGSQRFSYSGSQNSGLQNSGSQNQGYQVAYSPEGDPKAVSEVAIAPGTIVTVSQLFHSWLTRRQVPSLAQQVKAVSQMIQQLALCHPQVSWKIEKDDAPWLTLWPGATAKTLMLQMLRNVYDSDIAERTEAGLYLAVGLPDRCYRRRPDWVRIAINGRSVDVSELSYAVINSFRRTLPKDCYPVCFLHITLPPAQIDWNRHPAKSEIYVQGMAKLCDRITTTLTQMLPLDTLSESAQTHRATTLIKAAIKAAEQPGSYFVSRQISQSMPLGEAGETGETGEAKETMPGEVELSDRLPGEEPVLRAIAQVHSRYILAEQENGLCLIEQHIAHERVLYEQLQAHWQIVPLESPLILSDLSAEQVEQLTEMGIEVTPFGDRLSAIRSVPEPLSGREDCAEAIQELAQGANLEAALVAIACRTAIRNGTPLSQNEMQILLNQWQRTKRSRTCPHGRPICLTLKESSLAKYFRRSWVIGKSHGI